MTKHIVATVSEIPVGGRKVIEVDGREIGLYNVNGEFFAIRNRCPHQGGPLCSGRVTGFIMATAPGQYSYTRRGEIVRCPWHGWEFDIKTGQSWFDPAKTRVRNYKVTVEQLVPAAIEPPTPELEPGPYVAETYPVTIEQSYVVIEV